MKQSEAFDLLKLGHNVFLTGAAGSGKTYLINRYIAHLKAHNVPVAVTASTGIAATHLSGQTIHSWSGIGVRDEISDSELKSLAEKDRVKRNWRRAKVLVIDEISMLHAHQLDLVDRMGREVLDPGQPFGGLQVILCGDFFQLPPVTPNTTINLEQEAHFAYECNAWERSAFQICYLHEQFRQGDNTLLSVLNDIRTGNAGEHTKVPLRTRYKKEPEGPVRPTRLFARNVNVDVVNQRALGELRGETKVFSMTTRGFDLLVEGLKRSCLAPEELHLKIGAQVMFVKNSPDGEYVNGTRGVVEAFDKYDDWPVVRTLNGARITVIPDEWKIEENGVIRASLTQVPLRLAWAITIHKSQGMTLDAAEIDLSDAFEPGMGYVALSRVRSLQGLKLMGLNEMALTVHPKILLHDGKFQKLSNEANGMLASYSEDEKKSKQEKILFGRFEGSRGGGGAKSRDKKNKKKQKESKIPTHDITKIMLEQKRSLEEIAGERGLTVGTILTHMEKLKGLDCLPDVDYLRPALEDFDKLVAELKQSEDGRLSPVFERFGGAYSYDTIKLVRLFV